MTRSRHDAPALGVPVVDDIAAARARRDADKAARREKHIADSIAKTEARRAAAAETCADPDALRANLQASIAQSIGPCPLCNVPWRDHAPDALARHIAAVFDEPTNPSPTNGAA